MSAHDYAVIMAGGGGTRLWPLSRAGRPKQMLALFDHKTLFEIAVERLNGVFPPDHIYVVTVAEQAAALQQICPQIPRENYLIEPLPRGTAAVVGYAAAALSAIDSQAAMVVLTADHFIKNVFEFQLLLAAALEQARGGNLVTLGIYPTFAATGYGYVQRGEKLSGDYLKDAYRVIKFKEKPDADAARAMLADGQHLWNSGMFIWRTDRILEEFALWMPDLYSVLEQIQENWAKPGCEALIQTLWAEIIPETIDYGIMEKAEQVVVIPAIDLGWNDVGSWDSLFEVLPVDADGNLALSQPVLVKRSSGNLVFSEDEGKLIALLGVNSLVVIDTPRALLVCSKEQAQSLREIVSGVRENGLGEYL